MVWLLFRSAPYTYRPFSIFVVKAAAPLRSAWSVSTTINSARWPLAVCSSTHGAILPAGDPSLPALFPMVCEEPIAPATAMPAAMNKKTQSRARDRDDPGVPFEFEIMGAPEPLLYPKPHKSVNNWLFHVFTGPFASPRPSVAPHQAGYSVGLGTGVGRGLGVIAGLAVGVGGSVLVGLTERIGVEVGDGVVGLTLGVGVGVGVTVAVEVGVGVTVPVGLAVGVGVGVPPGTAKAYTLLLPAT